MSASEFISKLPRLDEPERCAGRQKPLELAEENEAVAQCNQAALEGALLLDRMENEDAPRQRP